MSPVAHIAERPTDFFFGKSRFPDRFNPARLPRHPPHYHQRGHPSLKRLTAIPAIAVVSVLVPPVASAKPYSQAAFAQKYPAIGKCNTPPRVCALSNGGRCNPKTGAWAIGGSWGGRG